MLMIAILFFAIAIVLGLYLLSFILRNKYTPKKIVFIHGPLAIVGLLILIIYAFLNDASPVASIILFAFAALGGIMMIYRDMSGKSVPKWMAIGHGLTALLGFVLLMIFAFFR